MHVLDDDVLLSWDIQPAGRALTRGWSGKKGEAK
jgi:hypothetical protein